MTLSELAKMRRMRARPQFPIVLTDDSLVHEFCAINDLPVIWTPGLSDDADLSPLYMLPLWMVGSGNRDKLIDAVKTHQPESMWVVGRHGYTARINDAVGREAMPWN